YGYIYDRILVGLLLSVIITSILLVITYFFFFVVATCLKIILREEEDAHPINLHRLFSYVTRYGKNYANLPTLIANNNCLIEQNSRVTRGGGGGGGGISLLLWKIKHEALVGNINHTTSLFRMQIH
ncbi:hypothetical protein ACJX0J_009303, partial [Zea mays]